MRSFQCLQLTSRPYRWLSGYEQLPLRTSKSSRRWLCLSGTREPKVTKCSLRTASCEVVLSSERAFSTMAQSQSWWEPLATPPPPDGQSPNLEFEQMDPEALPDAGEELLTRRVHLLGTGSIGTLVAHALKLLPNPPPVSILMHRRELYDDFQSGRRIVRLVNKNTDINDEQTGYDVDVREQTEDGKLVWRHFPAWKPNSREEVSPVTDAERLPSGETFIYTLIVTVKGPATVEALKSVKHRVDARTTVLLMQNGMGQIDLLNEKVFTDPSTRPTYMLGIISHGCHMQGPFAVVHAGFGTVALGIHRDLDRHPLPPKGQETPPPNLPSHAPSTQATTTSTATSPPATSCAPSRAPPNSPAPPTPTSTSCNSNSKSSSQTASSTHSPRSSTSPTPPSSTTSP